jgi:phospholipid/cholesterol/gamma-HCH transport system permease protein
MSYSIEKISGDTLKIAFSGRLDVEAVSKIWTSCHGAVSQNSPKSLLLDLSAVEYCDGAGLALIKRLKHSQLQDKKNFDISGFKPSFQKLLDYIEEDFCQINSESGEGERFPEKLGHITVDVLKNLQDNVIFLGKLTYYFFNSFLNIRKIRILDFLQIMEDTGPQAIPIVALIGFLIGLISTFQAAPSFAEFGAQIYMVDLVALGLVREMGPLLTSVLLAGRTASSFAAEIGTMKINQEIDALETMGISSVRLLVIPRILATMIITPILEVFFIIFGLLGSWVVMLTLGFTTDSFVHRLYEAIYPLDYIGGLIKVFVFGLVIAGVGCLHGIKTQFNAQAVGRSTTQNKFLTY